MTTHLWNHFAYIAQSQAGTIVRQREFGLIVDSGLDCDTFNVVVTQAPDAALESSDVHDCLRDFGGRRFSWWVGPQASPSISRALVTTGLEPQLPEAAMSRALPGDILRPSVTVEIVRVTTRERLQAYAAILAASWTPSDPNVIRHYGAVDPARVGGGSPLVLLLGLLDGRPAGTAELALDEDGGAGLYNVATLAAYRRRGVATALTAQALTSAQAAGMRNIELQASAEGQVIYERLGFRTHGAWIEYHPPKNR
jgi:ribosomal protein S18 acetylase RimI-like enzyme